MDKLTYQHVKILWDYMNMHMEPEKADVIVGLGCYYEEIALRCAELYFEGYAPKILFSGGLGRNTKQMWVKPEAERFASAAMEAGVPEEDILLERRSTNSGENLLFTRELLKDRQVTKILAVHKPFMERRVSAAMGVYWPEMPFTVTSPRTSIPQFIADSRREGISEHRVISILAGDYQRIAAYVELGYQTPQPASEAAEEAFLALCRMGYREELLK